MNPVEDLKRSKNGRFDVGFISSVACSAVVGVVEASAARERVEERASFRSSVAVMRQEGCATREGVELMRIEADRVGEFGWRWRRKGGRWGALKGWEECKKQ